MSSITNVLVTSLLLFAVLANGTFAADRNEFAIKREMVFEFTEAPQVSRNGDQVTITFASKANCDVAVVIEDRDGKVVRHLASGVLGDRAPFPLTPNSLKQSLVWDSKDDQGRYIDNLDGISVRVSLGLEAKFEKVLFWEPKKRMHQDPPPMQAGPDGVYVYDGRVFDHVVLYDHDGNYKRTVYPFPANKIRDVKGLHWRAYPQDGAELAIAEGFHQATYLNSGQNAGFDEKLGIGIDIHNNYHGEVWGNAASLMAVQGDRVALARFRLNRLATDGSTGGLPLSGPDVTFPIRPRGNLGGRTPYPVWPRSAAFSPDGKSLYVTGYIAAHGQTASRDIVLVAAYEWLPGVARLQFENGEKIEPFLGSMKLEEGGDDNDHFTTPTSVATDSAGRIYVTDYVNDRVQVFSAEGKFLKSIKSSRPAQICVHQRTGELFVFSWWLPADLDLKPGRGAARKPSREERAEFKPTLTVLRSFDDPRVVSQCPFPIGPEPERSCGYMHRAEIDSWAEPTTVWTNTTWGWSDILTKQNMRHPNIKVYELRDGKLQPKRDFLEDAKQSVAQTEPPAYGRQRLYVNPVTGHLYCGEGNAAVGKSFSEVVHINPESGETKVEKLPFDAEDMCFDINGLAYLRTFYVVARYDSQTWREVPWDYGEQLDDVRTTSSRLAKPTGAASVLRLPVKSAGLHHHSGMAVSPKGNLVVAVNNHGTQAINRKDIYDVPAESGGKPYTPREYPGRVRWGELHVWDKHGKMLHEDALPGLNRADGIAIDAFDNIYALSTTTRVLGGQMYFNDMTGTLLKVAPRKGKVMSTSETAAVPLSEAERPKRPAELANSHVGNAWLDGAEWFYGGIGFCGKNAGRSGGGCDCYNARFALDYLGRSFAPEIGHHSVAVLDSAGNLIMRIGQYGNADSHGSNSPVPLGGDEVGLFYAPYVATHTDRRLFIADPGNARIVSVALSYKATKRVAVGK